MIDKFFGFLLNLPKIQHLTVWLDKSENFYKTLLSAIHEKKLASFHIIVCDNDNSSQSHGSNSLIDWGQCIDTLCLGSASSLANEWLPAQKPEKRLRLDRIPEIDDFMNKNTTIKNLELVNFLSISQPFLVFGFDYALFESILQIIALEDLTISYGKVSKTSNINYYNLNRKLYQVDSLENLRTFTLYRDYPTDATRKVSPPHGAKMKNLKSICLESNLPFSKNSIEQLLKSISQAKSLEPLKIEGEVFDGLERKRAFAFLRDLSLETNLESASFTWKEAESHR